MTNASAIPSPLPKTMRALVHEVDGQPMKLQEVPVPEPVLGTVVVKVLASMVDPHLPKALSGEMTFMTHPLPFIPGSRTIGRVAAEGPDTTTLKVGQLVMIEPMLHARDNPDVKTLFGVFNGPDERTKTWFENNWRNGCFGEYARTPLEITWALDEDYLCGKLGLTHAELTFVTIDLVAYGGLHGVGVEAGETVLVAPSTGNYTGAAVGVALAMGARVIAGGRNIAVLKRMQKAYGEDRLKIVQMTYTDQEADREAIRACGWPIDCYIDISPMGLENTYAKTCMALVRDGGKVSLMGGITGDVPIGAFEVVLKNLTIKGQYMYEPADVTAMMKLVNAGMLALGKGAGHEVCGRFGMTKIEDAFKCAEDNNAYGQITVLEPERQ